MKIFYVNNFISLIFLYRGGEGCIHVKQTLLVILVRSKLGISQDMTKDCSWKNQQERKGAVCTLAKKIITLPNFVHLLIVLSHVPSFFKKNYLA